MHDLYGGFEYAARERRRELLEEARKRRLARLARPRRDLRARVAPALRLVAGWWQGVRVRRGVEGGEVATGVATGEAPVLAYLTLEASGESVTAVEIHLGAGGCVVRKTNLRTGASTDAFVADGR